MMSAQTGTGKNAACALLKILPRTRKTASRCRLFLTAVRFKAYRGAVLPFLPESFCRFDTIKKEKAGILAPFQMADSLFTRNLCYLCIINK